MAAKEISQIAPVIGNPNQVTRRSLRENTLTNIGRRITEESQRSAFTAMIAQTGEHNAHTMLVVHLGLSSKTISDHTRLESTI